MLEVTSLYLKPGLDFTQVPNNAKYSASIQALTGQPGFKILWEGNSEWNPDFVVRLIEWRHLTDHEAYMAKKDEYAQMVNPLLEMGATERDNFIHVRHLPPSSSFLDLSLFDLAREEKVTIFWLRGSDKGSLGRFAQGVRNLHETLRRRGCRVAGGASVEQAGECILFTHASESGQLISREEIDDLGMQWILFLAGCVVCLPIPR
ncbi:uncharacterized protein KD926_004638 [Aspergillus affinis]|uniref:uncharacterized protein n=1 Tax=Aspergillus affinis TaxID=1070780 RepID=UPI0022FF03B9|nr:uncharacterized protein KD926_004638 [Aspergillus affinis]KAI9035092.1 hypothetical protein KD926_004638 [Aspergillus affinis]